MRVKDIAKKYNIDRVEFEKFLTVNHLKFTGTFNYSVEDEFKGYMSRP